MSEETINRKNYTEREKAMLIEIIDQHKNIIENKCTNAISNQTKSETWASITNAYNACAEGPRTSKQLYTLYRNLKRTTRQNVASKNMKNYLKKKKNNINDINKEQLKQFRKDEIADKKAIKGTGGGAYTPKLNDVGAQMLALMGNQVKPLENTCDSATTYYADILEEEQIVVEDADQNDYVEVPLSYDESIAAATPVASPQKIPQRKIATRKENISLRLKGKENANLLKMKFYKKKLECALIEKRSRLLEYKSFTKKQILLDYEIKIKKLEFENLLKLNS